jgi:hypothetical protein
MKIPCRINRKQINNDKELLVISSELPDIYVISSKKWQTAYIHENHHKTELELFSDRVDLICYDKMGYRTIYEGINRFMEGKYEKLLKKII